MVYSIACPRTRLPSAFIFVLATGLSVWTQAQANGLDLSTAIERTLRNHPQLQAYTFKRSQIDGLRHTANLRPPVALGVEVENFAGGDNFESFDSAETTIAISSVIELGSQREKRVVAVNARERKLALEQQVTALALMAETTRRYIDVLAAQSEQDIAAQAHDLAQSTFTAVERRVNQGASPRAELLRAQAALARAQLAVNEAHTQRVTTQNNLRVMWATDIDANDSDVDPVSGDLLQLASPQSREDFADRLQRNPQVQLLAEMILIRRAELQVSESDAGTDIGWRIGVKHFSGDDENALVAGINLPLFSERRSRGNIQASQARLNQAQLQQDNNLRILQTRLLNLLSQYQTHFNKVSVLRDDVVPALEEALADAESAYQRGLYGYLELVAARQDLINAQHNLFDTAAEALRLHADIEQLIAEPFSLPATLPENPAIAPEVSQ